MSPARVRATWAPALMVGAAGAIAAEVAIVILLYASAGFMRSLTTMLAVEGVALAAGLHAARSDRTNPLERLRRHWLLALAAFLVAAVFGTLWSLFENLGQGRMGQGLGLALLAGLPIFACGALLGGMGAMAESDESGALPRPGAAAALGAGLGFIATGVLLPRAPIPASLLVGCLMLLSGGGMIYGAMVDQGAARRDVGSESSAEVVHASLDVPEVAGPGLHVPDAMGSSGVADVAAATDSASPPSP